MRTQRSGEAELGGESNQIWLLPFSSYLCFSASLRSYLSLTARKKEPANASPVTRSTRTDRSTTVVWERIRQTLFVRWVIAESGGFSCSSRPPLPVYDPPGKITSGCCRRASYRAAIP